MGLPDGPKSFRIGLVVLIQYRLWRTATHPASHVAVAITLNAKASSIKMLLCFSLNPLELSPCMFIQIALSLIQYEQTFAIGMLSYALILNDFAISWKRLCSYPAKHNLRVFESAKHYPQILLPLVLPSSFQIHLLSCLVQLNTSERLP